MIKIIDCPRDAMQGLKEFIPTDKKIQYLNQLLKVGFDSLDFGSFVSPRAIPQLRDTARVVDKLDMGSTKTKLLSIIANERGARDASAFEKISYLGFPFSISETFQYKNTNASLCDSIKRLENIKSISDKNNKKLVTYIGMGFGNPYNDDWNVSILYEYVNKLYNIGIQIIIIADTVGLSTPNSIKDVFTMLENEFSDIEFGAHFHTDISTWKEKVEAAYGYGCRRFDGALKGLGGCPMSGYRLVGNMPTENIISYFDDIDVNLGLNREELKKSMVNAQDFFPNK